MKTKFPYRLWWWTAPEENLFDLDKFALEVFKQITQETNKL